MADFCFSCTYELFGPNRNGGKWGVTPFLGMNAILARRELECVNEEKKGGGQTRYCEIAFVGVPCENIVGEREAICPLVNCIRNVQFDQRIYLNITEVFITVS